MADSNPLYEPVRWYNRNIAEKCVEALKRNGFEAYFAETRKEARQLVLDAVPAGVSVGVGGSVTVRELGIAQALKERGHKVFDHWDPSLSPAEKVAARDNQVRADVFLSSTNALTMDGALVNVDGTGNRVGSMIFGPKTSIVVCGWNKIVPTVVDAVKRIRSYAAPVNYKRLNAKAPCAGGGDCTACTPKMCTITTVIAAKPGGKERFVVVVVGDDLGY